MSAITRSEILLLFLKEHPFELGLLIVLIWMQALVVSSLLTDSLTTTRIILAIIGFPLLLACSVIMTRNTLQSIQLLINPLDRILEEQLYAQESNPQITKLIEEVSEHEQIRPPKIALLNIPIIASFGLDTTKSIIFLGKEILEILDEKQLRHVFYHEVYHIKNDLGYVTQYLIFKRIFLQPLNLALLCGIGLCVGAAELTTGPTPSFTTLSIMIVPGTIILAIFGALTIRNLLQTSKAGALSSIKHIYIREILADIHALTTGGDSVALRSAILKVASLKFQKQIRSHFLPFFTYNTGVYSISPTNSAVLEKRFGNYLKEAFSAFSGLKPSISEVEETTLTERIRFLETIEKIEAKQFSPRIIEEQKSFKITWKILVTAPEGIGTIIRRLRDTVPEILDELRSRPNEFDVVNYSVKFSITKFELFATLLFLNLHNVIYFKKGN